MSPMPIEFETDLDIFDLDFQESAAVEVPGISAMTPPPASKACVPSRQCSGTCWAFSCNQCCASSDWRTGC